VALLAKSRRGGFPLHRERFLLGVGQRHPRMIPAATKQQQSAEPPLQKKKNMRRELS
jgi:hypothetical protein